MIFLYTDFGATDLYVGQVKAVLHRYASEARVVSLGAADLAEVIYIDHYNRRGNR